MPTNDCVIESEKHGNIAITNLARKSVADARLIACAPDLLAMVERYASECAECDGKGTWVGPDLHTEPCDTCADLRALIARARGEP